MDPTSVNWLRVVTDLGSFGLVAWLFWYVFSQMLPGLNRDFRDELKQEREITAAGLRDISSALEKLSIIILWHDASVRGTDPSALGTTEDLLRILRRPKGGDE